jgi:hypothetical protein
MAGLEGSRVGHAGNMPTTLNVGEAVPSQKSDRNHLLNSSKTFLTQRIKTLDHVRSFVDQQRAKK